MKRSVPSVSTINSSIARLGIRAELRRGSGYFYFVGDAVSYAQSTSVMVYKVGQLTEAQWIDELRTMCDASDERRRDAEAHEVNIRG